MFNNFKNYVSLGFNRGTREVKHIPQYIKNGLDLAHRVAEIGNKIGYKAAEVRNVFNNSKKFVNIPDKINNNANKIFDSIGDGVKNINKANSAIQGVGGEVLKLF